jgi:hypothetical protein
MFAVAPIRALAPLLSCVVLAFTASPVPGQDVSRHSPQTTTTSVARESEDPHVEIKRLMACVERRLSEIDKLLTDAGAGSRGRDADHVASVNGAGELVRRSQDASRSVVRDIDRILELADHPHPPGGA